MEEESSKEKRTLTSRVMEMSILAPNISRRVDSVAMDVKTQFPSAPVGCAALPQDVKQHTHGEMGLLNLSPSRRRQRLEKGQPVKPEETATTEEVMTEPAAEPTAETNKDAHTIFLMAMMSRQGDTARINSTTQHCAGLALRGKPEPNKPVFVEHLVDAWRVPIGATRNPALQDRHSEGPRRSTREQSTPA